MTLAFSLFSVAFRRQYLIFSVAFVTVSGQLGSNRSLFAIGVNDGFCPDGYFAKRLAIDLLFLRFLSGPFSRRSVEHHPEAQFPVMPGKPS